MRNDKGVSNDGNDQLQLKPFNSRSTTDVIRQGCSKTEKKGILHPDIPNANICSNFHVKMMHLKYDHVEI